MTPDFWEMLDRYGWPTALLIIFGLTILRSGRWLFAEPNDKHPGGYATRLFNSLIDFVQATHAQLVATRELMIRQATVDESINAAIQEMRASLAGGIVKSISEHQRTHEAIVCLAEMVRLLAVKEGVDVTSIVEELRDVLRRPMGEGG